MVPSSSLEVSAAFFNPQSRTPDPDYLSHLQLFLQRHPHGRELLRHVSTLGKVWPVFAAVREDISSLPNGQQHVNLLVDWANGGLSAPISEARTGVIALPLLLVVQLGQYFAFLESHSLRHAQFIEQVRNAGGIQGCCGGEPPALSIACAEDESQIVENASVLLRIVLGVGAYIEALDDKSSSEPTIIAIRLKYEAQKDEITRLFPGTYVSAITEPRSLSFVGSADSIARLYEYAREQGLPADKMDVTGKAHNPENSAFVPQFLEILRHNPSLFQLPEHSKLRVPLRSNRTGEKLWDDYVMEDMIIMMLAACCDWYSLLTRVAEDLDASGRPLHHVVIFGMNDSVPISPFNKRRLRVSKLIAHPLVIRPRANLRPDRMSTESFAEQFQFPGSAIAIVGVSCRFPGARNLAELWNLVSQGGDMHRELPRERISADTSFRASQDTSMAQRKFFGNFLDDIKSFDHTFFGISPKEAASLDPQQRMLLEISYEALESSGYLSSHARGDPVGCFIGNSLNEYFENTTSHASTGYSATGTMRAFLCGRLSHFYGWTAPSEVVDTACSSSLVAVNRACRAIQTGECTMAVAGGVSVLTGLNNFLDLGKAGFLSPTGQCKPFDAAADGYCRAEGAGMVVLKRLSAAVHADNEIFGVIPGIATNQGGTSTSLTIPSHTALTSLYRSVLQQANLQPSQVSYIEAHGTGTQAGDPVEIESIRSVFGSTSRKTLLSVGSVKGNIGHCESAAGIAGLLKVLAMLRERKIPPQASHCQLNPTIRPIGPDGMEISPKLRGWDVGLRAALVNSYGAAGSNCALICCEMSQRQREPSSKSTEIKGENISFPIILSGASHTALVSNSRALAAYLAQTPSKIEMADLSFTLDQRRKRHRFCFETSTENISKLVDVKAHSFEIPARAKPVVLVFSGQYDSKVALDRGIYDFYPTFRSYINACDSQLVKLGYGTILNSVFQKTPITDAVSLQCSIFAVQYACASCWIDAGLSPKVIIGHSLGELVSLVVSKTLALSDCLKLVAFRARLIDTRWGAEKGAMLVVQSDQRKVQLLASRLASRFSGDVLEIACYNGPNSIVAVGSSATIDSAVQLLSTDIEFGGIKFQRLATTHAFHSKFTEPILDALEEFSSRLTWSEPSIELETCTRGASCLPYSRGWSPSRHVREPVYFSEAVARVEQRLGSCIWFEAGFNSPIIPMVKRASSDFYAHDYQAVDARSSETPFDCIRAVITNLWRRGISLSHWAYLGPSRDQFKQAWLPPYQFDRHQHWIERVDRATEAYQKLVSVSSPSRVPEKNSTLSRLVLRKSHAHLDSCTDEFSINKGSRRFSDLVRGHAVLSQPLCPAPLYMECVTMAIQLMIGSISTSNLTFQDLHFQAPLGMNDSQVIDLRVEELPVNQSWKFMFLSRMIDSAVEPVIHCLGTVSISPDVVIAAYGRLIESSIDRLRNCQIAERLKAKRAYDLFTKVMHYSPFFQGIRSITMSSNEAISKVKLPDNQPGRNESEAWRLCDAVLIDNFISVIGLLLNSSDQVTSEEVFISSGIERVVLTSACREDFSSEWLVYTKLSGTDGAQPIGDVFIYAEDNKLVAIIDGVKFAKAKISKLSKTLESANTNLLPVQPQIFGDIQVEDGAKVIDSHSSSATSSHILTPSKDSLSTALRDLVADYTGLDSIDVPNDLRMTDLGIDSLSSVEFSEELWKKFSIRIESRKLTSLTLGDILAERTLSETLSPLNDADRKIKRGDNSKLLPSNSPSSTHAGSTNLSQSPSTRFQGANIGISREPVRYCNPLEALIETDRLFEAAARKNGFSDYYSNVFQLQNDLTSAYIIEAFQSLGVDLRFIPPGSVIPPIACIPKHDRLVKRLFEILEKRGFITSYAGISIRSRERPDVMSSKEVYKDLESRLPQYLPEAKLIELAGSSLARCLKGEQDPLLLLFGSQTSAKIMEDYYSNSPMVSTLTDQLVTLVKALISSRLVSQEEPIRILEVGAGTGGTTLRLARSLQEAELPCQYMFTDISKSLVSKAKDKLREYPWITYDTFDLEKEVQDAFRGRFDIVIGTNCVHATINRGSTCRRIWETLTEEGLMILSEGTQALDWFDICFGLLDGWWLADDGTYPLQPAAKWMETFQAAGFQSTGFSSGSTKEAVTQQLLVGSKKKWQTLSSSGPRTVDDRTNSFRLETIVYTEVSNVQVLADVYIPTRIPSSHMPIALMIHGGGYMMLSRKAVRSAQTEFLLSRGFLPVSLDYRLCPEVNMIDGPITDLAHGYRWLQTQLPSKLLQQGVLVDIDRIVVIGWSTGGHLAMSLAWTTANLNMPPPRAILSFYAPIDFQSGELDSHSNQTAPLAQQSKKGILEQFRENPVITNYEISESVSTSFFGLQPGDPRSDLLLAVSRDGTALSLLLHGLEGSERPCSPDLISAIDPIEQLYQGNYRTPTFLVHSRCDEVAPFAAAEKFMRELKARGVKGELLALDKMSHLHDLSLKPGIAGWDEYVLPGYRFLLDSI